MISIALRAMLQFSELILSWGAASHVPKWLPIWYFTASVRNLPLCDDQRTPATVAGVPFRHSPCLSEVRTRPHLSLSDLPLRAGMLDRHAWAREGADSSTALRQVGMMDRDETVR